MALAVSDTPAGPYTDLHAPWFDFGYSAIDGHIFVDDDGKPYLYFSRNGVQDGYSFGIIYGVALADGAHLRELIRKYGLDPRVKLDDDDGDLE